MRKRRLKFLNIPFYLSNIIYNFLNDNYYGLSGDDLNFFNSSLFNITNINLNGEFIENNNDLLFLNKQNIILTLKLYKINMNKLNLNNLFEYSLNKQNIQNLIINYCYFQQNNKLNSWFGLLNNCINILHLNVSNTNFDDNSFNYICNNCPFINYLNISFTDITKFDCLIKLEYLENIIIWLKDGNKIINIFQIIKKILNLKKISIGYHGKFIDNYEYSLDNCFWINLYYLNINNLINLTEKSIKFVF